MADAAYAERLRHIARWAERLSRPAGAILSLVLLIVVLRQALAADWSVLGRSSGLSASFWATILAYYFVSPCTEWIIYTRIWGFDWKAMPALLRKLVYNELLLDFAGDVQFLAWARTHHAGSISPFAAVKDVTVLSALTGNFVTIVLTLIAWPHFRAGFPGVPSGAILASLLAIAVASVLTLVIGRKIFSHPAGLLSWIAGLLIFRTLAGLGLAALLWHLLMPTAPLANLFLFAVVRTIISRLPLVPSKELLFAGLAVFAFGGAAGISSATSQIATLVLLMHVAIGAILIVSQVTSWRLRRAKRSGAEPQAPSD